MAKQRNSKPPRRRDKPGAGGGRRKPCLFCKDKVEYADYKDVATLGRYTSDDATPTHRAEPVASRMLQPTGFRARIVVPAETRCRG